MADAITGGNDISL